MDKKCHKGGGHKIKLTSYESLNLQSEDQKLIDKTRHAQDMLKGASRNHECLATHGDPKHKTNNDWMDVRI